MQAPELLPPFELGTPGALRDQLVAAVLAGRKTATTSLYAEYGDEPLPATGERYGMLDSAGHVVGVVETTGVSVVPMVEVELEFAIAEGEGFTSVADWRAAHEDFWNRESLPALGPDAEPLGDETLVVLEWFRLVEPGAREAFA